MHININAASAQLFVPNCLYPIVCFGVQAHKEMALNHSKMTLLILTSIVTKQSNTQSSSSLTAMDLSKYLDTSCPLINMEVLVIAPIMSG